MLIYVQLFAAIMQPIGSPQRINVPFLHVYICYTKGVPEFSGWKTIFFNQYLLANTLHQLISNINLI